MQFFISCIYALQQSEVLSTLSLRGRPISLFLSTISKTNDLIFTDIRCSNSCNLSVAIVAGTDSQSWRKNVQYNQYDDAQQHRLKTKTSHNLTNCGCARLGSSKSTFDRVSVDNPCPSHETYTLCLYEEAFSYSFVYTLTAAVAFLLKRFGSLSVIIYQPPVHAI